MRQLKHYRRLLILLAMLSAATFANAQNGTKDYKVSGIVPDGINKIYIYKNNGLSSREMLDSVTVTDGRFTMSGTRPAYDLLSLGTTKGVNNIQFFNDGDPPSGYILVDSNDTVISGGGTKFGVGQKCTPNAESKPTLVALNYFGLIDSSLLKELPPEIVEAEELNRRGFIASNNGEKEKAIALLREAIAKGSMNCHL